MDTKSTPPFGGHGMGAVVEGLKAEIRELYLADNVPWIIGYSGGKDSTAVLQLVWLAIAEVLPGERHKPIHVITTDTGVENPVVAQWVLRSHAALAAAAQAQHMPIMVHLLRPELDESFWVNLIGRGYPAPRHKFRWCTDRCITVDAGSIVDAAHIHQFSNSRNNDPRNGIALSKNAHWLFDQGLWSLSDDYRVIVAASRFDEAGTEVYHLKRLEGCKVRLPANPDCWPDRAHLAWHRRRHELEVGQGCSPRKALVSRRAGPQCC